MLKIEPQISCLVVGDSSHQLKRVFISQISSLLFHWEWSLLDLLHSSSCLVSFVWSLGLPLSYFNCYQLRQDSDRK